MIESFKIPIITPETLTGSIVSFNDEYGGLPLKSCTSLISGYQEGTGTPSPDNVRPLHAWDNGNLFVSGKNIHTCPDSHITSQAFFPLFYLPAGEYTLSGTYNNISSVKGYFRINDADNNNKASVDLPANSSGRVFALLKLNVGTRIRFVCQGASVGYDFYISDVMLEKGTSMTPYEPYNGNTYTFTFGQSIYQGSIDWKRGVVRATHLYTVYNGSEAGWSYPDGVARIVKPIGAVTDSLGSYSNLASATSGGISTNRFRFGSTNLLIDLGIATLEDFKTYLSSNNFQLVYELATPIEIPLGGINLLTQEGQNNIFADCGDTEVKFLKVI